jgi:hypothetical protein
VEAGGKGVRPLNQLSTLELVSLVICYSQKFIFFPFKGVSFCIVTQYSEEACTVIFEESRLAAPSKQ